MTVYMKRCPSKIDRCTYIDANHCGSASDTMIIFFNFFSDFSLMVSGKPFCLDRLLLESRLHVSLVGVSGIKRRNRDGGFSLVQVKSFKIWIFTNVPHI